MTKNLNLILFIVLSLCLVSLNACKDDEVTDNTGNNNNNNNNNGNTTEETDYLPRANGNTWNYSNGETGTMTGSTTINGEKYWETTGFGPLSGLSLSIAEDLTLERVLYKEDEGVYSVRGELSVVDILGADGNADPIEYVVLDKNKNTGDTWTGSLVYNYTYVDPIFGQEISPPAITVPYTFEIKGKGLSLTVSGTTYEDVIHVNQKFDNFVGGITSTDLYYAEGVGIIRSDSSGGLTPNDLESFDLY